MNPSLADMDLLQCIDKALSENSEIKKARAEFQAFREVEVQSRANLLPSIALSVSRSRVAQDRSDGSGLKLHQNYIMESDAISLRQPVYRPKLIRDFEKTKKEVSSEKLLLQKKEDIISMKVIEAYFRLLRAYEEESLLEKRMKLLAEQKKAAVKSMEAGRGTVTELAEINAANDRASVDLIKIRQSVKLELNELEFYTGEKIQKVKKLDGKMNNIDIFEKHTVKYWEENAVLNNYELKSRREMISAAEIALSSEKLTRYPTIDLNIQISRGSSESTFFVDSETKTHSLGLSLNLPIYQGGGLSSRIRQSASKLDVQNESLKFEEEDLRKRVQKIYFGMIESIKLREALKTAVRSSQIELQSTKKSSSAGIRKQLDILISQQKALGIERELNNAQLDIILYWLNLNMFTSNLKRETIETINRFLIPR